MICCYVTVTALPVGHQKTIFVVTYVCPECMRRKEAQKEAQASWQPSPDHEGSSLCRYLLIRKPTTYRPPNLLCWNDVCAMLKPCL